MKINDICKQWVDEICYHNVHPLKLVNACRLAKICSYFAIRTREMDGKQPTSMDDVAKIKGKKRKQENTFKSTRAQLDRWMVLSYAHILEIVGIKKTMARIG